ncbi:serine protease inhibitor 14 [Aphomia sociella]
MRVFIIIFVYLVPVFGLYRRCSERQTLAILKRSTYDFSVSLLDRICQETEAHFVYSPLSTWLQLASLAEGANGRTYQEIWRITRHHRRLCFKEKWRNILNKMDTKLKAEYKRKNLLVVDKLFDVNKSFIKQVEKLNSYKVLLYNFNNQESVSTKVNKYIETATDGVFKDVLFPDDFNSTIALIADTMYYKSDWRVSFDPVHTKRQPFYRSESKTTVNMMKQIGYYNITEVSTIKSRVLEIPCNDNRISMLIFLPNAQTVWDLFYSLRRINFLSLSKLFTRNGVKLVNVELPRFKITTDIDNIPELLYDMGAKRLFQPDKAEFKGISDYGLYASMMTQVADIEVTESGVKAEAVPENLVLDNEAIDFIVNKPFVFMLVDKNTELILFSGAYSKPSLF